MEIIELIEKLQKHPNQNAEIVFKTNVIDLDEEKFDEESKIEIFNEDSFYEDFIEIICYPKVFKDEADLENNIHTFLENNSNIKIEINREEGIFILDDNNAVLREIEFSNKQSKEDSINLICLKLRKLL